MENSEKICGTSDPSLCGRVTMKNNIDIVKSTFSINHIAGMKPSDGDTHGDDEMIVCCQSKTD